jgi:uncharacterized protein YcbK (DUF882 family)
MVHGFGSGDRIGRRRALFTLGGAAALPILSACGQRLEPLPDPRRPGTRLDSLLPSVDPYLDVTNANTGERVALRFMDDGRYDRRAIRQLNWIFRDWRQNRSPDIDPRLFWALAAMSDASRKAGHSGKIQLISGYRTRRTNEMLRQQGKGAASNSYHLRRRAADIRIEGASMEEVADYAEWLGVGGVGRYSGSNFTHIDSGPPRTWSA